MTYTKQDILSGPQTFAATGAGTAADPYVPGFNVSGFPGAAPREIVQGATTTSGNPKGISIALGNTGWARVVSLHATIVTDATATPRNFVFEWRDSSGNILFAGHSGGAQNASLTNHYSAVTGMQGTGNFARAFIPIPTPFLLPAGSTLVIFDNANVASAVDTVSARIVVVDLANGFN